MDKNYYGSLLIDAMAGGFGIYLLYLTIRMKKSGKIVQALVPQEEAGKCRDEKSYVTYTFPAMLVFSIVCMISGIAGALEDAAVFPVSRYIKWGVLVFFLAGLAFFAYRMRKGKELYF